MFYLWGGGGLLLNLFAMAMLLTTNSVGVGTSAYNSALTLIWIGGMIFFAAGYLLDDEAPDAAAEDVLSRVRR